VVVDDAVLVLGSSCNCDSDDDVSWRGRLRLWDKRLRMYSAGLVVAFGMSKIVADVDALDVPSFSSDRLSGFEQGIRI
jgi:hypothetical protein